MEDWTAHCRTEGSPRNRPDLRGHRFYGIHRAVALHPFYREDYRKWLELTPWTVHKPLPLGPIALIWEDGHGSGGLDLALLTQPNHHSIRIMNVFLIIHSALLTATFWPTGAGIIGYLAAFGLGLARPALAHALAVLRRGGFGLLAGVRGSLAIAGAVPLALEWSLL